MLQLLVPNAENIINNISDINKTDTKDAVDFQKALISAGNKSYYDCNNDTNADKSKEKTNIKDINRENFETKDIQNTNSTNQTQQENILAATVQEFSMALNVVKIETENITEDITGNIEMNENDLMSNAQNEILNINLDELSIESGTNIQNLSVNNDIENKDIEGKKLDELIDEDILSDLNIEEVNVEVDSNTDDGGTDLLNSQTAEEQGIKLHLQSNSDFVELFTNSTSETKISQTASNTNTLQTNSDNILEQISRQMENLKNNSKVNIVLNPESIGKVNIQLINTKEGLSAQMTVANQEARDLLMKNINGLKETLLGHGVNVDNVSVKLENTQNTENKNDWTEQEGSRGGNKQQQNQNQNKENIAKQFEKTMQNNTTNENMKK